VACSSSGNLREGANNQGVDNQSRYRLG
jgi:hypothetical protein